MLETENALTRKRLEKKNVGTISMLEQEKYENY